MQLFQCHVKMGDMQLFSGNCMSLQSEVVTLITHVWQLRKKKNSNKNITPPYITCHTVYSGSFK